MKRIYRIALSAVLCCVLLLGCMTAADAALAPLRVGDTDFDYNITIMDATKIQRYLAGFRRDSGWYSDELFEAVGDADGSGALTILDATTIQRKLAGLPCSFIEKDIWDYYVADAAFHSSCEINAEDYFASRDLCCCGIPAEFFVKVRWGAQPRSFTMKINGETVDQVPANGAREHAFTYTFSEPGTYEVYLLADCAYGATASSIRKVVVEKMPEDSKPVIIGAAFYDRSRMNSGDGRLTVTAAGGTAPYQYSYELYSGGYKVTFDEDGELLPEEPVVRTGYIEENEIDVLSLMGFGPYDYAMPDVEIWITVRDAEGLESAPVKVCYSFYALVA